MRVGIGFDIHPLVEGRRLVLGGVRIEHPAGLEGHSDADVLAHAVIDALLGAAGLGDIGGMFPATDERFKDASSLELLASAVKAIGDARYSIGNVDATVIAEEPRLGAHLGEMSRNLAHAMGVEPATVNVKAKSPEGVGALGRKSAIAAQAIATVDEVADRTS